MLKVISSGGSCCCSLVKSRRSISWGVAVARARAGAGRWSRLEGIGHDAEQKNTSAVDTEKAQEQ